DTPPSRICPVSLHDALPLVGGCSGIIPDPLIPGLRPGHQTRKFFLLRSPPSWSKRNLPGSLNRINWNLMVHVDRSIAADQLKLSFFQKYNSVSSIIDQRRDPVTARDLEGFSIGIPGLKDDHL